MPDTTPTGSPRLITRRTLRLPLARPSEAQAPRGSFERLLARVDMSRDMPWKNRVVEQTCSVTACENDEGARGARRALLRDEPATLLRWRSNSSATRKNGLAVRQAYGSGKQTHRVVNSKQHHSWRKTEQHTQHSTPDGCWAHKLDPRSRRVVSLYALRGTCNCHRN